MPTACFTAGRRRSGIVAQRDQGKIGSASHNLRRACWSRTVHTTTGGRHHALPCQKDRSARRLGTDNCVPARCAVAQLLSESIPSRHNVYLSWSKCRVSSGNSFLPASYQSARESSGVSSGSPALIAGQWLSHGEQIGMKPFCADGVLMCHPAIRRAGDDGVAPNTPLGTRVALGEQKAQKCTTASQLSAVHVIPQPGDASYPRAGPACCACQEQDSLWTTTRARELSTGSALNGAACDQSCVRGGLSSGRISTANAFRRDSAHPC